ncbi:hypothetical protein NQ176_g1334 [Zarea fungicola]|uniref:Uncharacterized protein n=1 Tax=Zarea fungicola TaxID=93591 RepID=A0ACC1NT48_9HYPO|nr:hypothetical protein NQ176_g1334 [Lecanicillium fungicola]
MADRFLSHLAELLGGGSAINVGMWTVGHEADYNEWARIVNDESYSWQSIRRHLQRLENYGSDISPSLGEYSHPEEWHGKSGEVRLEFSGDDMTNAGSILSAFIESGNSVNLDVNSGKSLGIGVVPITTRDSWRVSAATAHLTDPPSNLQILTDATVSRIILKDGRASGVVVGETAYYASKEVVMSAGALRSPQLLMLSGIGPIDVLESVGINCVKDLPVGQALRDHLCIPLLWEVDQSLARPVDWVLDETAVVQHRQEFLASGAGPLKNFYSPMPVVYTRDAGIVSWNAMNELSPAARRHLANPNLPLTEICPVLPSFGPDKSNGYLRVSAFPMATQSTGSIKLHSASIKDQPLSELSTEL